jgi:hypothetical protein
MSEEPLNDLSMDCELLDLESSLRGLSAVANVNRDELLFEAGRRSAKHRSASRSGFWKGVSIVLTVMLVGQSFALLPSEHPQLADDGSPPGSSAAAEIRLPSEDGSKSDIGIAVNTELVKQETLPTRRSELLELRRVALTQGVDAAFSPTADDTELPLDGRSSRQELLRELLGS